MTEAEIVKVVQNSIGIALNGSVSKATMALRLMWVLVVLGFGGGVWITSLQFTQNQQRIDLKTFTDIQKERDEKQDKLIDNEQANGRSLGTVMSGLLQSVNDLNTRTNRIEMKVFK